MDARAHAPIGMRLDRSASRARHLRFTLLSLTVLLLPVKGLLGLSPFWILGTAAILGMTLIGFSVLEGLWTGLCLALFASLLINLPADFESARAIAAIYNIIVICVLIVFLNWGRQIQLEPADTARRWANSVYRSAAFCWGAGTFLGAALFAYATLTGSKSLRFTSLLGLAGELPGILSYYSEIVLISVDWMNGSAAPRIGGFGVYATESALLFALTAFMAIIYFNRSGRTGMAWLAELSCFPMLVLMGSRTVLLAYLLSLCFMAALRRGAATVLLAVLIPIGVVAVPAFGLVGLDFLGEQATSMAESRAGSTSTRLESYTTAYDRVVEKNVVFGLGIKPLSQDGLGIPIGSHSSLVSLFTKGGLVAAAIFVIIFFTLLGRVAWSQLMLYGRHVRVTRPNAVELVLLSRCIFVLTLWWLTEDLDAPMYEAALGGLLMGLFWEKTRAVARHR